jgi:hypothetical protein
MNGVVAFAWSQYRSRMQPCCVPSCKGIVYARLASFDRANEVEYNRTRNFLPVASATRQMRKLLARVRL